MLRFLHLVIETATFNRPREAILFLNECLARAEGKTEISWQVIRSAEVEYSRKRLRSLADEWHADFPGLPAYSRILAKRKSPFFYRALERADADNFALTLVDEVQDSKDPMLALAQRYVDDSSNLDLFLTSICSVLYQVGMLGFKPDPQTATQWSYINQPTIGRAQIGPGTHFYIHPAFWVFLGTPN